MRANITIIPFPDETGESMARRLHKVAIKEGIYKELKSRLRFTPRPEARRKKQAANRKRLRKAYTHDGQPLYQVERERRQYGEA